MHSRQKKSSLSLFLSLSHSCDIYLSKVEDNYSDRQAYGENNERKMYENFDVNSF